METSLEKLNAKIFAEQLHTKFKARHDNGTVALELAEVIERDISPRLELFCLVFHGPVAPRLPQMIYGLEHEKLGTVNIFLTAIAADSDGISYEAVFNRVKKK